MADNETSADVQRALGRHDAQIGLLHDMTKESFARVETALTTINGRLSSIELSQTAARAERQAHGSWHSALAGLAAGAISGVIPAVLIAWLKH